MNSELENQLAGFIESLNSGVDFAISQAPELVRQLLLREFLECAITLVCTTAYLVLLYKHREEAKRRAEDEFHVLMIAYVGSSLSVLLWFVALISGLNILMFPELFLTDYFLSRF